MLYSKEQNINYSRIHVPLCRLLYLYYCVVRRNVTSFSSANLPKSSVTGTIRALYKPAYYLLRLGGVVLNAIL
jgi:hypothetical protein